jgi:hypothetical protein
MAYNSGLELSDFRPRFAGKMGDVAGAASNATVGENAAALNANKTDFAGLGVGAIEAGNYKERMIQDANANAEINKANREAELEILAKDINQKTSDARDAASASKTNGIIKAGASIIGAAFMSDETTKNTIEKIEDGLAQLRGLQPVTYYYNEEYSSSPERLHHGFIAQEYQKVMPDATYFDESTGKLCIDTAELIALLVRGIQQLETRVTRMEAAHALIGAK